MENTSSPVLKDLEVYAAINPPGTNTPDIVSATTGTVFIARTPETFTYDADGNMTSDGRFHYYWNGENRLVMASNDTTIVTYAYDHRGRMVTKTLCSSAPLRLIKTTTYIWDNWNIIREIVREGDSVAITDNVWGLDIDGTPQGAGGVGGLLAVIRSNSNSNSALYFPTYDANGNISEYVSTNGEIVAHYDYSPFGEPLVASGQLASTFTHQFSTKPYCPVTGFSEYQMRKYNPEIGRWMSRDPIHEEGGFSLYLFVGNTMLNDWDALGLVDKMKRTALLMNLIEHLQNCDEQYRGCPKDDFASGIMAVMEEIFKKDDAIEALAREIGNRLDDDGFSALAGKIREAKEAIDSLDIPSSKAEILMASIDKYTKAVDSVLIISKGVQIGRSRDSKKLLPEYLSLISSAISLLGLAGQYAPALSPIVKWYTDATKAAIEGIDNISAIFEEKAVELIISAPCENMCETAKTPPTPLGKKLFKALKCE